MEELDLKVSGGNLLTEPTGNHRNVRQRDGRVVSRTAFRGLVSGREPSARAPLDWRGMESFAALCHKMWVARCWDAVRGATSTYGTTDEKYDPKTEEMQQKKKTAY